MLCGVCSAEWVKINGTFYQLDNVKKIHIADTTPSSWSIGNSLPLPRKSLLFDDEILKTWFCKENYDCYKATEEAKAYLNKLFSQLKNPLD
jgi:hypothetical protein